MTTTFIDTNKLPRVKTPHGEVTEILNGALAGAKNVVGTLRWLDSGETFHAEPSGKHQLIYLMEGSGGHHAGRQGIRGFEGRGRVPGAVRRRVHSSREHGAVAQTVST